MNEAWRILDARIDAWIAGFFYILPNLVVGAVIALFFFGIAYLASKILEHGLRRANRHDLGHVLSSFAFWGVLFIGFLVVITIILPSMKPADIFTSLGIGSVALGFAFKDILQNWLAGIFILVRRPFHRGDQIKIGDVEGTVQAVETRATLVKTYAGKLVIIPNTDIYTHSVTVNTAYENRRVEILVPLGMGVVLEEAIEIFKNAVGDVEHVMTDPPVDVLPWELRDNNVHVRVRWWTKSQRAYEVRTRAAVVAAIKRAAAEHQIDIPEDDTISFADTPIYMIERKEPKKAPPPKKPKPAVQAKPDDIDEQQLHEPRDPEAEKPKRGELNEGLEKVPR
ncbi:MAG: mechanosensitive ion channel family protein [Pseudolabrys sp.]|nr:mechanosensitive ion channel family protein [Pseudolabrys sp.]MBV9955731.1 mechanosensitive ion channel family protein [Pseudolabrys sp.]